MRSSSLALTVSATLSAFHQRGLGTWGEMLGEKINEVSIGRWSDP